MSPRTIFALAGIVCRHEFCFLGRKGRVVWDRWPSLVLAAAVALGGCTQRSESQVVNDSTTGAPVSGETLNESNAALETASPPELPVENQAASSEHVVSPAKSDEAVAIEPAEITTTEISSTPGEKSFAEWPVPKFALFITGRQHGYIEPCGCTGLANQKGGLARRHSALEKVREKGWPTVALDAGNQVRRFGRQPEIKFQTTINGLRQMKYDVIAFGPDDLRLSSDEILAAIVADETNVPFASTNVDVVGYLPTFRVLNAAGHKVGVTTVLGDSHHERVTSDELVSVTPAADALRNVSTELEAASCDLYVLMAHASLEESRELARAFPQFDVVVTAGGAGEPTYQPEAIEGSDAVLIQVGTKGMYAGVVGVYDDAEQPLRYQRVALDAQWPDSAEMIRLLAGYQQQLEALRLDGLELRPVAHPSGRQFVGSEKCGECHTTAHAIWAGTPHSHATQTLVKPPERYEVPRHFDPECLSCHVTGWNAQGYYPYTSGYLEFEASRHLHGNGCENCHGPGSEHVAAEEGEIEANDDQLKQLREQMKLEYDDAKEHCLQCHDIDNSPDFHIEENFEKKYWPEIKHLGKD